MATLRYTLLPACVATDHVDKIFSALNPVYMIYM